MIILCLYSVVELDIIIQSAGYKFYVERKRYFIKEAKPTPLFFIAILIAARFFIKIIKKIQAKIEGQHLFFNRISPVESTSICC